MAQPLSATRGWKKLQQEYIADNLYALRRKKLDDLLTQSITGLSCEEMTLHYTSLSFLAMHCALCAYMQDGSLSQAEHWLCLSAQARGIVNTILPRNPRWEPAPVKALPMEDLTAALLCGQPQGALDALRLIPTALEREKIPLWNGKPDTRIDQKQERRRKHLLLLQCELYSGLLQGDDLQARQALAQLNALPWSPVAAQALSALLDGDTASFTAVLALHMKDFRAGPYPGELNYTVLFWEALWQRRGGEPPVDLADAPVALLKLPASDPLRLSEALCLPLPPLEADVVWSCVDLTKTGPKCRFL